MIYFDNAATSYPKPRAVIRETVRTIKKCGGNPGRGSHILSMRAADKIYECRELLCDFFSFDKPENVIFTPNATYALNLAIKTKIKKGSHVLISDMEHNSVLRPVSAACEDAGAEYGVFTTLSPLSSIKRKLRDNTDIIICNHVSNVSARKQDIAEIGRLCRERGIYFIVDASQSAGHTEIDMTGCNINALCAPAHKGLMGIQGAGFVILNSADGLDEFMQGGSGVNSSSVKMPVFLPDRYEAGTLFTPAIAALGRGVSFVKSIGLSEIEWQERILTEKAAEMLKSIDKVRVFSEGVGTLSFVSEKMPVSKVAEILMKNGICCRAGLHCAPLAHKALGTYPTGSVRLSFGYFNKHRELNVLWQALKEIKNG
ncbi:MAG: aminotransferase class V-fold PLP-dependent enzyme [Clostridia bacterium]|nr:aminotransferase class V-fold PLP-dependent enzyme [Clostridia bacterium]